MTGDKVAKLHFSGLSVYDVDTGCPRIPGHLSLR